MNEARQPLIHRVPLGGFDVELRLPRDLSTREAARIIRLLGAIALDNEPGPPAPPLAPGVPPTEETKP